MTRKLVINEAEAALVRDIFARYAEHGSAAQLVRQLQIEGHTTKSWTTQTGKHHSGRVIDQQFLFTMLRNRLYLGEMVHKGNAFPGQHEPIVSQKLWDDVHAIIDNRKQGLRIRHTDSPALLSGLLYTADGQRMLPTFTQKKNGKRYRYYVPYLDKRRGAGATADGMGALPAAEIESAVLARVHQTLQSPEMIITTWQAASAMRESGDLDEPVVVLAMNQISKVWQQLFPVEQHRIMRLLIERVQIHPDGLEILWNDDGWRGFYQEMSEHPFVAEQRDTEAVMEQ